MTCPAADMCSIFAHKESVIPDERVSEAEWLGHFLLFFLKFSSFFWENHYDDR